jgi:1,4-alpha-glucan branching enzyme
MQQLVKEIIGPDHPAARADRIVRIPNGIHLDALGADASDSRFAGDHDFAVPFILGLGRTIRRKGFHLLIDAFASCQNRHPDWRLVIAGDGRELPELKRQAEPLGQRVLFTGLVEGSDKRWLLQNCRFLATPSLEESFPNVALEGLACGKPVIGTDVGGFPELIQSGENGCLIPPDDIVTLAAAIGDYMSADLRAASVAALASAQRFSWPRVAAEYLSLIRQLS